VSERLSYVAITPARDEAENLRRLGRALAAQTLAPESWIVVDNGSTDDTPATLAQLESELPFLVRREIPASASLVRGGPIVRAFHAGVETLRFEPGVVVKLDADTSFEQDYFDRLVAEFERRPRLGIASGSAWELEGGEWVQRHATAGTVWGATRAYRRECLDDVLPLEERMGWDGIDALKANLRDWETDTLVDLPFRHHRLEGERDGARRRAWSAQGSASRFMGYRFSYLVLRALHHSRREPAALAMISGYLGAAARREPSCADAEVRTYLRDKQRARTLPLRMHEALGRRST
jgi:glycosyltransferase involved in cell wall biosynthesis